MNLIRNLAVVLIVLMLLSSAVYIIFYTGEEDDTTNPDQDTEPPQIEDVSGALTVNAGGLVTIQAFFSDNVNVTVATLYYKAAAAASWQSISILSGEATITIPSSATQDYYYYVTVDDAAGNGPVGKPSADGSTYFTITVIPGDNGNGGDEDIVHTVLVEEATATWCSNCPSVAAILDSLYESGNYRFYYVSLVEDKNTVAHDRLANEYNIYGYPTVFIDGGYSVILGGNKPESTYADAITAAQDRPVPKLRVKVTAEYMNTTQEAKISVKVENKGADSYSGHMKLYLTEIISQWNDYNSKPYRYGFLDYLINEDFIVSGQDELFFNTTEDVSAYDYENLMLIAVSFSTEPQDAYANPPDGNVFDAYYADATDATTLVQGGNLPPSIEITSPQRGKIYLNGNPILERMQQRKILGTFLNNSLHNITKLFGTKVITVNATDDSGVAKVEFYIDDVLRYNDTEAPYEYSFKKFNTLRPILPRKHTLKVVVYDDTGKSSSASLTFKARI